jgi:putative molybdopterin biosynthesis protein
LDPKTGSYNVPFLSEDLDLQRGYRRLQGIVHRSDDSRFAGRRADEVLDDVRAARLPDCMMVNRNQGSGTRILIDRLLQGAQPPGYAVAPRSHNAVAAAVVSGRADWGVAIETVARRAGLSFIPLDHEQYDFLIPKARRSRPAVEAFCRLLGESAVQEELRKMGFDPAE